MYCLYIHPLSFTFDHTGIQGASVDLWSVLFIDAKLCRNIGEIIIKNIYSVSANKAENEGTGVKTFITDNIAYSCETFYESYFSETQRAEITWTFVFNHLLVCNRQGKIHPETNNLMVRA